MSKFEVVYIISEVEEDIVEAESVDDAKEKWEAKGFDGDVFIIRDEEGNEVVY